MASTRRNIPPDSLAWLAENVPLSQLISSWRTGMATITGLSTAPTEEQFRRAKHLLVKTQSLTALGLSKCNLGEMRSSAGLLLLAELLQDQLAAVPAAQKLSTPSFNPVLALAMIMVNDRKLPPTIMPAPHWFRSESSPPTCSDASSTLQQNLGSLIFTECEAHDSDTLRRLIPGSHPVAMSHDALVEELAKQPSNHWLTIVIPALRAADALPALQSICQQSNLSVTILVIAQGPSNPSPAFEKMARRLRSSSKSALVVISALDCGPYDAMNLGIKLAHTPWIYFMGVDDSLHSHEVLAKVHDAAEQVSASTKVIYGNVEMCGAGHGTYDKQIYAYAFDYKRLQTQTPCHQAIFYRVDALREIGGYSLAYPICADWHANLRLWQTSAPIFVDLTVAKFSRGGISSTVYDYDFFRELPLIWEQNKSNLATPSG